MLQLANRSPFKSQITVLPDADGIETLCLTLKGTFRILPSLEIAEDQQPVVMADRYWGEPATSSLRYATEVLLPKTSTDVVLNGRAWAPSGKPASRVDVSLTVGGRSKALRVHGDRHWDPGWFWPLPARRSAAKPFTTMPLVYERAYGGTCEIEGRPPEVVFEPRNPVGRGFAAKGRRGRLKDLLLPNIEDPSCLVRRPGDRPVPAGFGYIAPSWEPRRSRAGTYDDDWQRTRSPYLPADFDPRFFNAAHPDLVMDGFLAGGEAVEMLNVTESGRLAFSLPTCRLDVAVRIAGRVEKPRVQLETVLLEPDEARVSLVWRAAVPCDKRALRVEEVRVLLDRVEIEGGVRS